MAAPLKLISHKLCPYVQRAVIALTEKGVPFERIDIDLANKPDWFLEISPLGKTPVLLGRRGPDFRDPRSFWSISRRPKPQAAASGRSAAARRASRLDRIRIGRAERYRGLLRRAGSRRRSKPRRRSSSREVRAAREARVAAAPWFDGENFSLVDAVFAPVFRYFDVFDEIDRSLGILADKPKLARWRKALAARPIGARGRQRRLSGAAARLHRAAEFVAVGSCRRARRREPQRTLASRMSR